MKIHKIHIENIASLKGSHKIDFDSLFQESSLFAITGKTGAGKSSILNSISLALYGKVYKADSQHQDFITLGEASGGVELEFSNQGKRYQASWQLKVLKQNGEPYKTQQQPIKKLALMTNSNELQFLETSVESVLNLTFDQFCKTTILNQGQFAKLLTSSFKDRKSILEKFYEGISLEKLNIKLLEKLRLRKANQEEFQNQILGLTQAFEEIDIKQEQLEALNIKCERYQSLKEQTKNSLKYVLELQESLKSRENNEKRRKLADAELSQAQKEFNKIKKINDEQEKELTEASQDLNTKRPLLIKGAQFFAQKVKNGEQKEYITHKENLREKRHQQLTEQSHKNTSKLKSKELEHKQLLLDLPILKEHEPEFVLNKIEIILRGQEREKLFKNSLLDLIKTQDSIADSIKNIEVKKSENLTLLKKTQEELGRDDLQGLKRKLQDLISYQSLLDRSEKSLKSIKQKLSDLSKQEEQKLSELSNLSSSLEDLRDELETIMRALDYFSLSDSIAKCLEHSQKDNTCIVCKQVLPTKLSSNIEQNDKEREELGKKKLKIEAEITKKIELTNKLKVEKLTLSASKEQIKQEQTQITAVLSIDFEKMKLGKNEKNLAVAELIDKTNSEILSLEKKVTLQTKLSEESRYITKDLQEKRERLNSIKNDEKSTQEKLAHTKNEIATIIQKLNLSGLKTAELILAQEQAKAFSKAEAALSLLKKDQTHIEENLNESTTNAQKFKKELEQILREEKIALNYLETHFDSISADPNSELQKLEQELQKRKTHLLESEKNISKHKVILADIKYRISSFSDQSRDLELIIESSKKVLAEAESQLSIAILESDELKEDITSFVKTLAKINFLNIDDHLSILALEESYQINSDITEKIHQKHKELDQSYSAQMALFKKKQENEKKVKHLLDKKVLLDLEVNKLNDLYDLIGKDHFRNYILSLLENLLINQTNLELERLYQGRYSLSQTHHKNKSMSEFMIVDYYKDGMTRKVSTLSGGETFLVSLAMALALAELTRGQTEVDSLFIDEGFGTLDADSIEDVFELLEAIQHSGKQIGIISHVQALTSRIGVNINLNKNTEGSSKVDIRYN